MIVMQLIKKCHQEESVNPECFEFQVKQLIIRCNILL